MTEKIGRYLQKNMRLKMDIKQNHYHSGSIRMGLNDYFFGHNVSSFTLSIEAVLEENMPVVTDKYEYDFRHK